MAQSIQWIGATLGMQRMTWRRANKQQRRQDHLCLVLSAAHGHLHELGSCQDPGLATARSKPRPNQSLTT